MESRTAFLQIVAFILCTWGEADSFFNTDTREPILRRSPAAANETHRETYGEDLFGFAIALHRLEVVLSSDDPLTAANKTRIIVGAPRGTFPGGLNLPDPGQPALRNTGLVYSCSVAPGSDAPCEGVRGDEDNFNEDNDALAGAGRLFDQRPNARVSTVFGAVQAEQKEGQLMGQTLFSRDGMLVVCAPAWTSTGTYDPNLEDPMDSLNLPVLTNALPQGRCYVTSRQLNNLAFLDPCNLRGESDVTVDRGYCTAGTDVDILEPGRFAIGAPGVLQGIGTIFYGRNQAELTIRDSDTAGQGNMRHPTPDGLRNILETSQAFQLTAAYITISSDDTATPPNIVASVPRFDSTRYTGRLDVYDARETGGDIQELLSITAEGQQIAEFFGYALAAMDLNGDSYDDIVVGAPMYSQIDAGSLDVEVGRAYVFMNTGGNLTEEPIIFEGSAYGGRFGMSVVDIGDIDRDGFDDVAIGAPYEDEGGESSGVVYIYYGSDDLKSFRTQTPGRISGQDLANSLGDNFTTFGFSVAALDVDNNQHNDLAIGVLDSGDVVLLRSRPVAYVTVVLTPSVNAVKRNDTGCRFGGNDYACFDVTVDLSLSGISIPEEIDVTVIVREIESDEERRTFFESNSGSNMIMRTFRLNEPESFTERIYVLNDITDSSSPLKIVAEVQQHEVTQPSTPTDGDPDIDDLTNDYIIGQPSSDCTTVNLTNNCGSENICQTDFALSLAGVIYVPKRDTDVEFQSIEVDGIREVRVQLTLSNMGSEDAIILSLNVSHNNPDVFSDRILLDSGESCTMNQPCNIRELAAGTSRIVTVSMTVLSDAPLVTMETTFTLTSSDTVDLNEGNNVVTQEFIVDRRSDLAVSLIFPQDVAMYTDMEVTPVVREDVGVAVSMEVRVSNVRTSDVGTAELKIYYPAMATSNNFFLLPDCQLRISFVGGNIMCDDSVLSDIDPLPCDASGRRKRHSVSPAIKQYLRQPRSAGGLHRTVRQSDAELDCSRNRDACLVITCSISQLSGLSANEARVTLQGYVDNRFFFDKDGRYELIAYADVTYDVPSDVTDPGKEPDSASATITISQPRPPSSQSDDSTTIIIVIVVVIVGSILLIITIAVILYFCGFFKRKKKVLENEAEPEGQAVPAPLEASEKQPPEGTSL